MAVNKRYYWMKFFDTFFQDAKIKKLKRLAGGDTYIVITLKMMLLTIKTNAIYEFEGIEKTLEKELSLKIDEDEVSIKVVIEYLYSVNMLIPLNKCEYEFPYVLNCIGSETESTARSRKHREKKQKMLQCNVPATKSNTEIDIELKVETDWDKLNEKLLQSQIRKDKRIDRLNDLAHQKKEEL